MEESESQIVLHACRALEIMSGCLANTEIHHSDGILFWDIIFEPMISLSQASETILREAACDCLSSMSENVFTQLPVRKPENSTIIQVSINFEKYHYLFTKFTETKSHTGNYDIIWSSS